MEITAERLHAHVRHLAEQIGPRMAGSREDQRGMDYIAAQLRSFGLEPEYHRLDSPCWEHRSTELTLVSSGESLPAQGCQFSVACDVTGDVVVLESLNEVNNDEVAGKVCLLSFDVPGDVTGRNLMALALEARGAAVLIVDRRHLRPDAYDGKYVREPDLRSMPVACVSRQVAEAIRAADSPLRLAIDASFWWGHTYNIEAVIPGSGEGRVFIGAHHDSAVGAPGARDDASGVAIALELARTFSQETPPAELRLMLTGGHERLGQGAVAYVHDKADLVRSAQMDLNLDGIGVKTGTLGALVYGPEAMLERTRAVLARHGDWRIDSRGPEAMVGDGRQFAQAGLPCICPRTLAQDPLFDLNHTQFDDLDCLDIDLIQTVARASADLLRAAVWRG